MEDPVSVNGNGSTNGTPGTETLYYELEGDADSSITPGNNVDHQREREYPQLTFISWPNHFISYKSFIYFENSYLQMLIRRILASGQFPKVKIHFFHYFQLQFLVLEVQRQWDESFSHT